jgi:hypothetical protein
VRNWNAALRNQVSLQNIQAVPEESVGTSDVYAVLLLPGKRENYIGNDKMGVTGRTNGKMRSGNTTKWKI